MHVSLAFLVIGATAFLSSGLLFQHIFVITSLLLVRTSTTSKRNLATRFVPPPPFPRFAEDDTTHFTDADFLSSSSTLCELNLAQNVAVSHRFALDPSDYEAITFNINIAGREGNNLNGTKQDLMRMRGRE
jgi:hypothetical protein